MSLSNDFAYRATWIRMGTFDSADFRAVQHEQWDSAAIGWKVWSEFTEAASAIVCERLVALAGVRSGSRVLDIAAGYGEPALTAARAAGPNGQVIATDISAEMLAFGRERAAAAGIENVEFVEADAASLEYPPASFDAAVSRWGIIFDPDAEAAAARVRGFLKPGSLIAISSWGSPDRVPFLSVPMNTTRERFGIPAPPPGTPGPLSRPTHEALGGLLKAGGFSDVAVEEVEVVYEFDSPTHFTEYVRAIAAPIRLMISQHAGGDEEAAWEAIAQAAAELPGESEPLRLSNLVLIASGAA